MLVIKSVQTLLSQTRLPLVPAIKDFGKNKKLTWHMTASDNDKPRSLNVVDHGLGQDGAHTSKTTNQGGSGVEF